MKTIKSTLIISILSVLLIGCSDSFLDKDPYGSLNEKNFFQNEEQAIFATNACYASLVSLNGFWATGTLLFGNLCSDDCTQNGAIDASYVRGNFSPGDDYLVSGSYKNAYSGIARCNGNIKQVKDMPENAISTEMKNRLIAEMRFIRAFWYFRLVRLYGDVPMITEPIDIANEEALYPSRTSIEKIYADVIIPDFKFAVENLPEEYPSPVDASRVTKGAAHAFLSKIYLNTKDWNNAIVEGEKVIDIANKGIYHLQDDLINLLTEFNEFNKESVFEIGFSKDMMNWKTKYYGPIEGGIARGGVYDVHFNPTPNLRDAYSLIDGSSIDEDNHSLYNSDQFWLNRDPRFDATFYTALDEFTNISGDDGIFDMKWTHNKKGKVDFQKNTLWYGPNDSSVGLDNLIMRYAEVLLNLAEAYIMNGQFLKGEEYINMIRERARQFALSHPEKYNPNNLPENAILPDISISDKNDGLTKLRYERRVEFAGEDVRGYDIRRWGIESETWAEVQGFPWQDKMKYLPIPQTEINTNENLVQTEGY